MDDLEKGKLINEILGEAKNFNTLQEVSKDKHDRHTKEHGVKIIPIAELFFTCAFMDEKELRGLKSQFGLVSKMRRSV